MKKIVVTLMASMLIVACTKNTTNNNTTVLALLPSFTVNGVHDIVMVNGGYPYASNMAITVQYNDSVQQKVTLTLSSLPPGITMDTTWISAGIPTYATTLLFYDTTAAGATPGDYTMTLTAKGEISGERVYKFSFKIKLQPPCDDFLLGKYTNCFSCTFTSYSDSIYADPTVVNKVWIPNVGNTGLKVYGYFSCLTSLINVPMQVVGGDTCSGSISAYMASGGSVLNGNFVRNGSTCTISMQR